MTTLVVDVENTFTQRNDKNDLSPFCKQNFLVSVGLCEISCTNEIQNDAYHFFRHNDLDETHDASISYEKTQQQLDKATLIVGHYLKHDLQWLLECGFKIPEDVMFWDTAIGEYVLARGLKWDFSLDATAKRRKATHKKKDLTREYLRRGIGFEAMPIETVDEYGRGDIRSTAEVFITQQTIYQEDRNKPLLPTVEMMNEYLECLTEMERNGVAIDLEALNKVEEEYIKEKAELETNIQKSIYELMGDRPINPASPIQMSEVVYSRRVKDKAAWKRLFNLGTDAAGKKLRRPRMKAADFTKAVRENTVTLKKQKAHQCSVCNGTGKIRKKKKDGTPFAKDNKCSNCDGTGLVYTDLAPFAGLKMSPLLDTFYVSDGGFSTKKEVLERLASQAIYEGKQDAAKFLQMVIRLNAVDTYLASFVGGIKRGVQDNGILHAHLNQTITSTGRLSSSDPNMQNQPRAKTFPVKKAFVSRFDGGMVLEADYAQLEFRAAAELSGCPKARTAILNDVDVHQDTASILTEAGQPTERQEAKPRTFKPLYGGSTGTPAEVHYFKTFLTERYPGIGEWHSKLQDEAISNKTITLPSKRQYAFPAARRTPWGGAVGKTRIVNYPVQGFATADIVPCAIVRLRKSMKKAKLNSLLILTVHDSVLLDIYPGELEIVRDMVVESLLGVIEELRNRYEYEFTIPLEIELKAGSNWLETELVGVYKH